MNEDVRRTKKKLPVELSNTRVLELYQERRELTESLAGANAALADIQAELKKERKDITSRLAEINQALDANAEELLVNCETAMDYSRGRVIVTRCDTGQVIEKRDMHPAERQAGLNLPEPEAGEEEAA